jgi:hypothetical protein
MQEDREFEASWAKLAKLYLKNKNEKKRGGWEVWLKW